MSVHFLQGDCLHLPLPNDSVDLVFTSPPYEDARTYGIDFKLRSQAWVDWAVPRFIECLRVCRGLVAWVVEGKTRQFRWSATPALLMADLHRAGVHLRKPPAFYRIGTPGSGGPDWWRNNYEFVICATCKGKLPWSDNTATGHRPIYAAGGACTNRTRNGQRVHSIKLAGERGKAGERQAYAHPKIANPGNVIKCKVGGGHLGHPFAHENEAPFPESLVEPFILSFCPPGGIVLDPFSGSGTTAAVAIQHGRRAVGIDIRQSQCDLGKRRVLGTQMNLEASRA